MAAPTSLRATTNAPRSTQRILWMRSGKCGHSLLHKFVVRACACVRGIFHVSGCTAVPHSLHLGCDALHRELDFEEFVGPLEAFLKREYFLGLSLPCLSEAHNT